MFSYLFIYTLKQINDQYVFIFVHVNVFFLFSYSITCQYVLINKYINPILIKISLINKKSIFFISINFLKMHLNCFYEQMASLTQSEKKKRRGLPFSPGKGDVAYMPVSFIEGGVASGPICH